MNRPQEFVVVNQAAETAQLTFKKLEITACTCMHRKFITYYSCINKQTGRGDAASDFIKQVNLLLLAHSNLLNN